MSYDAKYIVDCSVTWRETPGMLYLYDGTPRGRLHTGGLHPAGRQRVRPRGRRAMRALWRGIRQRSAGPAGSAAIHHSTAFLSSKTQLHLALCILNVELQHDLSVQSSIFTHLWREAGVRVCVDGAANRLHDSLADADRGRLLPDLIKGDLDSIRDDVAAFYRGLGVPLERDAETDRHDFDKCLRWLEQRQENEQPATPFSVVALGVRVPAPLAVRAPTRAPPPAHAASAHPRRTCAQAFGGRLDQTMANINMAYRYSGSFERFVLLSDDSIAFVLPPGAKTATRPQQRDSAASPSRAHAPRPRA